MKLLQNYQRVPLMTPQPHVPIIDSPEFRHAVDFFVAGYVTIDRNALTPFKSVYLRYVDWCEIRSYDRISKIYFRHAVMENGIVWNTHASGYKRRIGVRINEMPHPDWYFGPSRW